MTTAERIKHRREQLGMTQADLAEKMGLKGKSSISKIEASQNKVTLKTVEKAAAAMGCRPAYLMGWTDEPMDGPLIRAINEKYGARINDFERLQFDHTLGDDERNIIAAYRSASPDTQAAVRAILHIEED